MAEQEKTSIAQQLQERSDRLKTAESEIQRMVSDYAALKVKHEEGSKIIEALNAKVAQLEKEKGDLNKKIEDLGKEISGHVEAVSQMKAKLELSPAASLPDGVKVGLVGDGQTALPVDHKKVMEGMSSKDKIKYYREHKDEIDGSK